MKKNNDKKALKIFNKGLTKKVASAVIAGTIALSTLAGNQIVTKASSFNYESNLSESYDIRLKYTVKPGDTLWSIVSKYTPDNQVKLKVFNVALLNKITNADLLEEDLILNLDVPVESSQLLLDEYYEFIWEAKIAFLRGIFNEAYADNKEYWDLKDEVDVIIKDTFIAREDLYQLIKEKDVYGEYNIRKQQELIEFMLELALNKAEQATGINFYNSNALKVYNDSVIKPANETSLKK